MKTTRGIIHHVSVVLFYANLLVALVHAKTPAELDRWLSESEYQRCEPHRTDLLPGKLVQFRDGTIPDIGKLDLAVDSHFGLTTEIPKTLDLRVSRFGRFFGLLSSAEVALRDVSRAVVHLDAPIIRSINLVDAQDAIKSNTRYLEAAKTSKHRIHLIWETISVKGYQIKFFDRSDREITDRSRLRIIRKALAVQEQRTELASDDGSLVIGYKAVPIRQDGTVLGNESELAIGGQSSLALTNARRMGAIPPAKLYSEFQICALLVGLGNYQGSSNDALGVLPGAFESVRLVEQSLKRCVDPQDRHLISTFLSHRVEGDEFDESRRLSRDEIANAVRDFVADAGPDLDPDRKTAVFFYYFGHGAADQINHWPYLVPETMAGPLVQPIHELDGQLIPFNWIRDQLSRLSGDVIILADCCRSHEFADEELVRILSGPLGTVNGANNIKDVANILQFMGGIYGPTPMVFAGKNGMFADTIVRDKIGAQLRIGPLAHRFDRLIRKAVEKDGYATNLDLFILELEHDEDDNARGYTLLRDDFRDQLSSGLLLSRQPKRPGVREKRYEKMVEDDRAPTETPSEGSVHPTVDALGTFESNGIVVEAFQLKEAFAIRDFAYFQDLSTCVSLDVTGSMSVIDRQSDRLVNQIELVLPELGRSRDGALWIYKSSDRSLWIHKGRDFKNAKQLENTRRISVFGEAADASSVLVVETDAYSDTRDELYRYDLNGSKTVCTLPRSGITDVVELPNGDILSCDGEKVWRQSGGKRKRLTRAIETPTQLSRGSKYVFCLDGLGRAIYRIKPDGSVDVAGLFGAKGEENYQRPFTTQAFQMLNDQESIVGGGGSLWRVDLSQASWISLK